MAVRSANIMAARGMLSLISLFSGVPAYTVSSRCGRDPDIIRPQRHGQNDTIRKGGNNYHQ